MTHIGSHHRMTPTTTDTAATIASAARSAIPTGGGYLIPCPCPSHGKGRGDLRPSHHIRDGERRLLVRCYAGCEPAATLQALGFGADPFKRTRKMRC